MDKEDRDPGVAEELAAAFVHIVFAVIITLTIIATVVRFLDL